MRGERRGRNRTTERELTNVGLWSCHAERSLPRARNGVSEGPRWGGPANAHRTTEEAYKALTSGEQIPVGEAEWHVALDTIVRALLDPKPELVEAGRKALQRLANLTAVPDDGRRIIH